MFHKVCGEDGLTYNNQCLAECQDQKVACDGGCPCPQDRQEATVPKPCYCGRRINLVCGGNNETFNNRCLAKCSNQTVSCTGKCPCTPQSPKLIKKVVTVEPRMVDKKEPLVDPMMTTEREKTNVCGCPEVRSAVPVCGSDGRTYRTVCEVKCARLDIQCLGDCPCDRDFSQLWKLLSFYLGK